MATINMPLKHFSYFYTKKSLAGLAVFLSLLFLLGGCQDVLTPEQATTAFWEAMAEGDIDSARKYATEESQHLVIKQQNLEGAAVKTGAVLIDGANARVSTTMTLTKPGNNKVLSFDSVLLQENGRWKVDYQRTLNNLFSLPFGDIFKSLQGIGEAINKGLEQQIPLFEKQIQSFGEALTRQLEEFRRQLETPAPPEKQQPRSDSI